jgi:hypothetical protein
MASRIIWPGQFSLPAASILAGTYTCLMDADGNTALTKPARQFIMQNLTNQPVQISLNDGQEDSFPLAANGYYVSDITTNIRNEQHDDGPLLPKGSCIAVKALTDVVPTTGSVYFSYWCEVKD